MKIYHTTSLELPSVLELLVLLVTPPDLEGAAKRKGSKKDLGSIGTFLREILGSDWTRHLAARGFDASHLSAVCFDSSEQSVLLVGWSESEAKKFGLTTSLLKVGARLFRQAERVGKKRARLVMDPSLFETFGQLLSTDLPPGGAVTPSAGSVQEVNPGALICEGALLAAYSFTEYKKKKATQPVLEEILLSDSFPLAKKEVQQLEILAHATNSARTLVNLSPQDCTPSYLVEHARGLAKRLPLTLEVLDNKKLEKLGAGALLAVGKGSDEPTYLIKLRHLPLKKSGLKIGLIGKGITYDSGGYCLKPAESLKDMKLDMGGAAAVLGAMEAIAGLGLGVEVLGLVPTCENMINGSAMRAGDVITSLSGTTIEVLNTDAEGRLILADAITIAEQEGCDIIVDVATLTGACMVALGLSYAGLFTDDEELAARLEASSTRSGEKLWRLPLAPEYDELIRGGVAEIKNLPSHRYGGAITAALFLKHFITKARWAHLDIAGTATVEKDDGLTRHGGTGFGVRTLTRFVEGFSESGKVSVKKSTGRGRK